MKKILFVLIVAFLLPRPALGCTIPVFRYALEKWDLTTHRACPAQSMYALTRRDG